MRKIVTLNHHAGTVLPYHVDLEGKLHFVLEQKDPGYNPPFFDNGLNFPGGNWEKGKHSDKSPEDVARRELAEEFWCQYDAPEASNPLLGKDSPKIEPVTTYGDADKKKIQQLGRILAADIKFARSYIVTAPPPITKTKLVYGLSTFVKRLSLKEFQTIERILQEFDGKVTTDNLRWDSRTVSVSLEEINLRNLKFSGGYDHVVNNLLELNVLPTQPLGVMRTLNLIKVSPIKYPSTAEMNKSGCPTFAGLEKAGYSYRRK